MYGLIGKMKVVSGQRDALISILIEGIAGMPGCLSYVVARDQTDQDAIWITEVWISQRVMMSLSLPSVQRQSRLESLSLPVLVNGLRQHPLVVMDSRTTRFAS